MGLATTLLGRWILCDPIENHVRSSGIQTSFKGVAEGGIYFKCATCSINGVMKDNDFAKAVRAQMEVEAPDPCGVKFDTCEFHKDMGIPPKGEGS